MDSGIVMAGVAGHSGVTAAVSDRSPAAWARVSERVALYLRALGIEDPLHRERLLERVQQCWEARVSVQQRWEARVSVVPPENPVETGIEETSALLDAWLCAELDIMDERDVLFTARAAVLSGAVPNWAARFAGVSGESIAAQVRAAGVQPTPEPAPLDMESNTIHLCCHDLGPRIIGALRVLAGHEPAIAPPRRRVRSNRNDQ
jgi:hypothetical protein